jgi:SOS-response transcriptional repressor LexA
MDEIHPFSMSDAPKSLAGSKAIVVSPFGHRMVPIVSYGQAAQWITSQKAYPVTDRTEVEWVRLERASDRVIGVVVEEEEMMDEIGPGDHVFLDPALDPKPGDYVLAHLEYEKKEVLRKYRPRNRDRADVLIVELVPLNEDYPTHVIDSKNRGRILGVMVEYRKYRRRNTVSQSVRGAKERGK